MRSGPFGAAWWSLVFTLDKPLEPGKVLARALPVPMLWVWECGVSYGPWCVGCKHNHWSCLSLVKAWYSLTTLFFWWNKPAQVGLKPTTTGPWAKCINNSSTRSRLFQWYLCTPNYYPCLKIVRPSCFFLPLLLHWWFTNSDWKASM